MKQAAPTGSTPKRPLFGRVLRFAIIALAALAALAVIFYLEENSRGRRAWAASKSALESQQETLDWSAYIPPAVPDDQNFFKAPKMQEWFVNPGTSELTNLLSLNSFAALARQRGHTNPPTLLAEWILRSPGDGATNEENSPAPKYDTFKFDRTSLRYALEQLARAGNLNVEVDPHVDSSPASAVTGVWTNVTAQAVLLALVCNNNLHWADDPDTGTALIKAVDLNAQVTGPDSVNIVLGMLRKAIAPSGEATEGFAIGADLILQMGPMQLSVPSDGIPAKAQITRLFSGSETLRVEPVGNTLHVTLGTVPVAAADYLKWSDQFSAQFDLIREAVKRPKSRIEGDYQQFNQVPSVDFAPVEVVTRMLADRARCYLILNQPDQALAELTLLNDLLVCLARPGGKPVSLASAAGVMAFRLHYAETISFGLRIQAWGDPELTALQDQLSHIDLVSLVWNAMESDRAWECRYFETAPRSELAQSLQLGGASGTFSEKMKNHKYLVFKLMPEGWIYRNLAHMASLRQGDIDAVDRNLGIIHPHQVTDALQKALAVYHKPSPLTMLAKLATPPLGPTLTVAARVQTLVNETLVVCALERSRLGRGLYPDKLDVLAPDFIPVIPLDPIDGGPLQYHHLGGGHFLLYSIGWDEKDDGGAPTDGQGNGDWVWGGR